MIIAKIRLAYFALSTALGLFLLYSAFSEINIPTPDAFYFPEFVLRILLICIFYVLVKFQITQFRNIIIDSQRNIIFLGSREIPLGTATLAKKNFLFFEYFTLSGSGFIFTNLTHNLDKVSSYLEEHSDSSEGLCNPMITTLVFLTGLTICLDGVGEIQKLILSNEADRGELSSVTSNYNGLTVERSRTAPHLRLHLTCSVHSFDVNYHELKENIFLEDMQKNPTLEATINASLLGFIDKTAPYPGFMARYFQHPEIIRVYALKGPLRNYTKPHPDYLHVQDIFFTMLELLTGLGFMVGGILLFNRKSTTTIQEKAR